MNVINRITLKSLNKNKTRTIVTIIGVLLSAAMITAVTTFISSLQTFLINTVVSIDGNWQAGVLNATTNDLEKIQVSKKIKSYTTMVHSGYAKLEGSSNQFKPYLYLLEFDNSTFNAFSLKLVDGRLPQNKNEILISNHIYTNGGIKYKVGEAITLNLGTRKSIEGEFLYQHNPYVITDNENPMEVLTDIKTVTFTIVGICERPGFENYSAPGYTIITYNEKRNYTTNQFDIFLNVKKPSKIYDTLDAMGIEGMLMYHNDLLRFMGISNNDNFNTILYSLGAILMILIMIGSISLIYNAFSISVSERKKQYGLLSGAGATSKQLKSSVLFEAFFISAIGIPLGIACGVLGIGVTLYLLKDIFISFNRSTSVEFGLSVSLTSILVAVIVGIVTVLISAYIPARRCSKMSAMDAIRQTTDIKMNAKHVKTWRLTRKLFGMEGDLALKNIKRNRKRYRATVISLFISIVLFISASSFSMYTMDSVSKVYQDINYDLSYSVGSIDETEKAIYNKILSLDSIQKGSIISSMYADTSFSKEKVLKSYYDLKVSEEIIKNGENLPVGIVIYSVDDVTFRAYLDELGENQDKYFDRSNLHCIVVDHQQYYDYSKQRMIDQSILNKDSIQEIIVNQMSADEIEPIKVNIGKFTEHTPLGIPNYAYNSIVLIIPDTIKSDILKPYNSYWNNASFFFKSDEPFKAEDEITKILLEAKMSTSSLTNRAEMMEMTRNTVLIVRVFSYGFIVLISLITIANVFNTISTNINLRKREFAMLRSVGLTSKGFKKMLNYECIFYGIKALIYGMPVALLFTYLIYKSLNQGVDVEFYLPLTSIALSVFMVFAVVFTTMLYSMSKIKKENILDSIKIEE